LYNNRIRLGENSIEVKVEDGELDEKEVCRDFRHTANDGKIYTAKYYNSDAIISMGYCVNSKKLHSLDSNRIFIIKEDDLNLC
jgi:hypothetical protein